MLLLLFPLFLCCTTASITYEYAGPRSRQIVTLSESTSFMALRVPAVRPQDGLSEIIICRPPIPCDSAQVLLTAGPTAFIIYKWGSRSTILEPGCSTTRRRGRIDTQAYILEMGPEKRAGDWERLLELCWPHASREFAFFPPRPVEDVEVVSCNIVGGSPGKSTVTRPGAARITTSLAGTAYDHDDRIISSHKRAYQASVLPPSKVPKPSHSNCPDGNVNQGKSSPTWSDIETILFKVEDENEGYVPSPSGASKCKAVHSAGDSLAPWSKTSEPCRPFVEAGPEMEHLSEDSSATITVPGALVDRSCHSLDSPSREVKSKSRLAATTVKGPSTVVKFPSGSCVMHSVPNMERPPVLEGPFKVLGFQLFEAKYVVISPTTDTARRFGEAELRLCSSQEVATYERLLASSPNPPLKKDDLVKVQGVEGLFIVVSRESSGAYNLFSLSDQANCIKVDRSKIKVFNLEW